MTQMTHQRTARPQCGEWAEDPPQSMADIRDKNWIYVLFCPFCLMFSFSLLCLLQSVRLVSKRKVGFTVFPPYRLGRVKNVTKRVFKTHQHFLLPFYVHIWDIQPKKAFKEFLMVGNGPQNWAPPLKSENFTSPKHRHVGCLSRGNGLECWRCALRFQIW